MTVTLLTGATGNLGGGVLFGVLDRGSGVEVRVLLHRGGLAHRFAARSIDARAGDYSARTSLDGAFAGVDRILLLSSPVRNPMVRVTQHRAVKVLT